MKVTILEEATEEMMMASAKLGSGEIEMEIMGLCDACDDRLLANKMWRSSVSRIENGYKNRRR